MNEYIQVRIVSELANSWLSIKAMGLGRSSKYFAHLYRGLFAGLDRDRGGRDAMTGQILRDLRNSKKLPVPHGFTPPEKKNTKIQKLSFLAE